MPIDVWTASILRGGAAGPRANAGVMASRSGSDRATPAQVVRPFRPAGLGLVRGVAVAERPVPGPPPADHVEALQGEPRRVDPVVTSRARRVGAVLGEQLPDGRGAADVRLDGRHVARR